MLSTRRAAAFYALVVGTAVFIYVTGGRIINPTYDDWLMIGDSAQHYIGWEFFRHTPLLQWPIADNPKLGLEVASSIVFTDSIPIAAFIFKPLNYLLPATFQYFGLWIWMCFVLQAFFAWKLLSRFVSDRLSLALASSFLVISPVLIYRFIHQGYGHIALGSQFLLLAALYLYFDQTKNTGRWAALIVSTILIHAYFIPMILAIWFAWLLKSSASRASRLRHLLVIGFSVITTFVLGGYIALGPDLFLGSSSVTPDDFPYRFRWQPLALIDSGTDFSGGWSRLLMDRTELFGDVEGFSFLGSGVIALICMVFVAMVAHVISGRDFGSWKHSTLTTALSLAMFFAAYGLLAQDQFSILIFLVVATTIVSLAYCSLTGTNWIGIGKHRALLLAVSVLALYSMTNRPGVGRYTFFEYPLIPIVKQFTQTFRTHGRSIWPAYYLLVVVVIIAIFRVFGKRVASLIFLVALTFQVVDSVPAISISRERFSPDTSWTSPLSDPRWAKFATSHKNLLTIPPLNNDVEGRWIAFTHFAAKNNLGTNAGYFSRIDPSKLEQPTEKIHQGFMTGRLDPESFYVVTNDEYWAGVLSLGYRYTFVGEIDGFHVVVP